MAAVNFHQATDWLLVHEGGYVNHPKDPGGATNQGVTQAVYDGYRIARGKPTRSVREIIDLEVRDIYLTQYWRPIRGDDLPMGLDYALYDFAVNSGVSRAVQFLQKILGVKQDGIIGNVTMGAVSKLTAIQLEQTIRRLCEIRLEWLKTLKTWADFGVGWTRRIMGSRLGAQNDDYGVIDRAVRLHKGWVVQGPRVSAPGKGREEDKTAAAKVKDSLQSGLAGAVSAGAAPVSAIAAAIESDATRVAFIAVAIVTAIVAGYVFWRKVLR